MAEELKKSANRPLVGHMYSQSWQVTLVNAKRRLLVQTVTEARVEDGLKGSVVSLCSHICKIFHRKGRCGDWGNHFVQEGDIHSGWRQKVKSYYVNPTVLNKQFLCNRSRKSMLFFRIFFSQLRLDPLGQIQSYVNVHRRNKTAHWFSCTFNYLFGSYLLSWW